MEPPPTPLSRYSECVPPPVGTKGGGHSRRGVSGRGGPNSDDWRKNLVLCLLRGLYFLDTEHIAQLFVKLWIMQYACINCMTNTHKHKTDNLFYPTAF